MAQVKVITNKTGLTDDFINSMKVNDIDLLNIMIADMEKALPIYQPTNFWSIFIKSLTDEIRECGIAFFRKQKHALGLYVPTYSDDEMGRMEALCDYKVFLAGDVEHQFPNLKNISESQVGSPSQQFVFDNKYYSRSLLNYLRGLAFLKKSVDTSNIRTVLEIGGGFGTFGEIFLKSNCNDTENNCNDTENNCNDIKSNCNDIKSNSNNTGNNFNRFFYVNIDIPPLSYISTKYLEEVFGKENIANYELTRELKQINVDEFAQKYRAMVLCPWQLPRLTGDFDLFVNFFSFQEMEPDVVENYATHINKLVKKYILLRNQKSGKQVAKKAGEVGVLNPVSRNDYIKFFSPFELIGIDSKVFGNQKDGFESEVLVFRKKNNLNKNFSQKMKSTKKQEFLAKEESIKKT